MLPKNMSVWGKYQENKQELLDSSDPVHTRNCQEQKQAECDPSDNPDIVVSAPTHRAAMVNNPIPVRHNILQKITE